MISGVSGGVAKGVAEGVAEGVAKGVAKGVVAKGVAANEEAPLFDRFGESRTLANLDDDDAASARLDRDGTTRSGTTGIRARKLSLLPSVEPPATPLVLVVVLDALVLCGGGGMAGRIGTIRRVC